MRLAMIVWALMMILGLVIMTPLKNDVKLLEAENLNLKNKIEMMKKDNPCDTVYVSYKFEGDSLTVFIESEDEVETKKSL